MGAPALVLAAACAGAAQAAPGEARETARPAAADLPVRGTQAGWSGAGVCVDERAMLARQIAAVLHALGELRAAAPLPPAAEEETPAAWPILPAEELFQKQLDPAASTCQPSAP